MARNPTGHLPLLSADKGRFGPLDVKHIAGHILHQDAQSISEAKCRNPKIPASLLPLGTTLMAASKTATCSATQEQRS